MSSLVHPFCSIRWRHRLRITVAGVEIDLFGLVVDGRPVATVDLGTAALDRRGKSA
jgi:hypothetical protein